MFETAGFAVQTPFARMSYDDAMLKYGSDKPDLRPGMLIHDVSLVFSDLGTPWLNARVGRFEPAYVAFSVKRHLSVSPYEVYDYGFPSGSPFSETQEGVEVSGWGRCFTYAAGLVNGSGTNLGRDVPSDVYARAAVTLGGGAGQSAGQRLGVTGYFGRARPLADAGLGRKTFNRLGVDLSLNWRQVNFAAQYLVAHDGRWLWADTVGHIPDDTVTWSGGFVEVTWQPVVECLAFGRWDTLDAAAGFQPDLRRWTGGARYYFADNVALHLEASRLVTDVVGADDIDTVGGRLDFAF